MDNDETDAEPSEPTGMKKIHLASWGNRFVAWLIDVILVGAVLSAFGQIVGFFSLVTGGLVPTNPFLGANGLGLWLYWTALEGYSGQSAGKMVVDIAVTDERGDDIDLFAAGIESFGKAFLLPLDVLIGWLVVEDEYGRLFNKLSSTIVVELPEDGSIPDGVEYVSPKS
jgi:uncharacterized RDD family membrane protein YckC